MAEETRRKYRCRQCNAYAPHHCPVRECGWVICPTHGILRLTAKPKPPEAPGA